MTSVTQPDFFTFTERYCYCLPIHVVVLKGDRTSQVVQDDQVKGPLRVGSTVEVKSPEGRHSEAVISKLTDASWYTVVFDDGDEKTLRRTSLCLKGERHFAESEVRC
uniref:Tudor domain-containing protein n=1 Tax=Sinocyclocheilus grahami TaxID=75366 RepID=A0A672KJ67_SINGR